MKGRILGLRRHSIFARAKWIALRLAFVVSFALFVLAMFEILPDIFLLMGFGMYCVAIPFWLYPKESLVPKDELAAMAKQDAADMAGLPAVPIKVDPGIPEAGPANASSERSGRPGSVPSDGDRTVFRHLLQLPFVAMVATRIVPNRWRGG